MKKLLLFSILAVFYFTAKGQYPDYRISAGGGIVYGSLPEKIGLGINVSGYYNYSTKIRLNPNFSFYIPYQLRDTLLKITQNYWEFNLDFHYVVQRRNSDFSFYPLAGIVVVGDREKIEYRKEENRQYNSNELKLHPGVNIGVGGQYKLNDRAVLFIDLKGSIIIKSNLAIRAGILFGIK
jgi:hypothetical protein